MKRRTDLGSGFQWGTFLGEYDRLLGNYGIAEYNQDRDRQRVEKSVVMSCGWNPDRPELETEWLQSICEEHNMPSAIVGYVDLSGEAAVVEDCIAKQLQFDRVRGMRQILSWNPNPDYSCCAEKLLEQTRWQKNFELMKKYELSFDMQVYSMQMPAAAALAAANPDVQIVINHCGMPLFDFTKYYRLWLSNMKLLAAEPNISMKISGLGMFDHRWNTRSISPLVRYAIEIFGVDRCMFASHFPVDGLYRSYDEVFDAYSAIVRDGSEGERDRLFYGNAARIYRL